MALSAVALSRARYVPFLSKILKGLGLGAWAELHPLLVLA